MAIKIQKDPKEGEWIEFVNTHPHGNIFQTPFMTKVYQTSPHMEPLIIVAEEHGEICGVLQAVIQKEFSGIAGMLTTRAVIMGGPLIRNSDPAVLEFLLVQYDKLVRQQKAIYSQYRNHWVYSQTLKDVFFKQGYVYKDHLDILHDLNLDLKTQFMKMSAGRRKNIRRAEKMNLRFEEVKDKEEFQKVCQLIKETYKRIKLPVADLRFFNASWETLYERGILKSFVAIHESEIISARIVLCYKDLIYDWYAGSSEDHLDKYPNDYLPWMIMKWGTENDYATFDFGGAGSASEEYGVRDYKLKFGGELVEYGRFEKVHSSFLMYVGKMGLKLYKKFYDLFK